MHKSIGGDRVGSRHCYKFSDPSSYVYLAMASREDMFEGNLVFRAALRVIWNNSEVKVPITHSHLTRYNDHAIPTLDSFSYGGHGLTYGLGNDI